MLAKLLTPTVLRARRAEARLPEQPLTGWGRLKRATAIRFRDPQQGGYVHDTAVSVVIPPRDCLFKGGTWTDSVGNVANTYMVRKTAGAATTIVVIPVMPLQNSAAYKGSYLKSIDIWWELATATLTTLTAAIQRAALPADTAAFSLASTPAFSYDALNDTNAKRVAIEQRKMTLTITTPFWLDADDQVFVELTVVDPGTSVFDFYGARANYTLRL